MSSGRSRLCPCLVAGLQRLSFPFLFGGAGSAAAGAYTPANSGWLMPLVVVAVGLLTYALERLLPYAPAWNNGTGTRSDAGHLAATAVFAHLGESLAWSAAVAIAGTLPFSQGVWPRDWPLPAQIVLALAVGDFLPYLYHRASHETQGFLWRVHAIHHAPERLYTLNFARFHPLNAALTAGLTLLPLAALGAGPFVLFVAGVLHNVHGVLSHANVDFRLGPLNAVFSMAELHRWHHARDPRLANGNYSATLTVWDWLFRTRRNPGRGVARDGVGLWHGSALPPRLLQQWIYPFAQLRLRRAQHRRPPRRWRCCQPA
ncbi:sterol desaturase family protein [Tahibacter harae]|uniref:Sterol desaturase family protein n=1 Tax=Tahibacter harae TaxID=2963937 RepID=A0ABT1QT98_9GAMM|nr:sterol desaturase family protein [Tahibacter harae]